MFVVCLFLIPADQTRRNLNLVEELDQLAPGNPFASVALTETESGGFAPPFVRLVVAIRIEIVAEQAPALLRGIQAPIVRPL